LSRGNRSRGACRCWWCGRCLLLLRDELQDIAGLGDV
jgi:hypothetical protein